MARPKIHVPPEHLTQICNLHQVWHLGARRISNHMGGIYSPGHVSSLFKQCYERQASASEFHPLTLAERPTHNSLLTERSRTNPARRILRHYTKPIQTELPEEANKPQSADMQERRNFTAEPASTSTFLPTLTSQDSQLDFDPGYTDILLQNLLSPVVNSTANPEVDLDFDPIGTYLHTVNSMLKEKLNRRVIDAAEDLTDKILGLSTPMPSVASTLNDSGKLQSQDKDLEDLKRRVRQLSEDKKSEINSQDCLPSDSQTIQPKGAKTESPLPDQTRYSSDKPLAPILRQNNLSTTVTTLQPEARRESEASGTSSDLENVSDSQEIVKSMDKPSEPEAKLTNTDTESGTPEIESVAASSSMVSELDEKTQESPRISCECPNVKPEMGTTEVKHESRTTVEDANNTRPQIDNQQPQPASTTSEPEIPPSAEEAKRSRGQVRENDQVETTPLLRFANEQKIQAALPNSNFTAPVPQSPEVQPPAPINSTTESATTKEPHEVQARAARDKSIQNSSVWPIAYSPQCASTHDGKLDICDKLILVGAGLFVLAIIVAPRVEAHFKRKMQSHHSSVQFPYRQTTFIPAMPAVRTNPELYSKATGVSVF